MRAALLSGNEVANVIEYDSESDYEPVEGLDVVELADDTVVSLGWTLRNGSFVPPPLKQLTANLTEIPTDDSTPAIVFYQNTFDDAPAEVEFNVNGATATVPVADGVAQLEITADQPGDILVTCDGLELTITATEVSNATN